MVTVLHDAERDKRHQKTFQRPEEPPVFSSESNRWEFQKKFLIKNKKFKAHLSGTIEPSNSSKFQVIEPEINIALPSIYLHNTKVSTASLSPDNTHTISSFLNKTIIPLPKQFFKLLFTQKRPNPKACSFIKITIKCDPINHISNYHKK